ncbi:NUDIX hydrolase [Amphibiibacter pelophylacis]|uniref:CoA pyrophosphatase n=1 Tax=Amphibiibacter pelophylacis TaxID=1799477 RepID=A0ACC6P0E8_9BURK
MDPAQCPELGRDGHLPLLPASLWPASAQVGWGAVFEQIRPLLADIARADDASHATQGLNALDQRLGLIRGRPWPDRPRREAAVLVGVFHDGGAWRLLLTQRTATLREHAGEISFPGGRIDPQDSGPIAAALRESQEEVGLAPGDIQVLGLLPGYVTVTNYRVAPVLAQVDAAAARTAIAASANSEVAHAFAVPLAQVLDPCQHVWRTYRREGVERRFVSMPAPESLSGLQAGHGPIWGATAAMLRNLYLVLAWSLCEAQMNAAAALHPWRNEY